MDGVLLPVLIIAFAVLWLHVIPEYWWTMMIITIVVLIWLFTRFTKKFEKYK
jgi:Flp pilus assembly protein TadB